MSDVSVDIESVRAEIAEEVRRRRAGGAFDALKERELEQLFHQYAPLQGRDGALAETLRAVDVTAYIDPHVPVASSQPAGTAIKRSLRKASFWYMSWIAAQVTRSLSTVARSLHLIDDELTDIRKSLDGLTLSGSPVIALDGADGTDAWWAAEARALARRATGRVLVSACADGWLVADIAAAGGDAYGLDPRPGLIMEAEIAGLDLRDDDLLEHLDAVADDRLAGIVLNGTTEALLPAQRRRLLRRIERVLTPDALVVLHAVHPDAVDGDEVPAELDLAGARPLRPTTWTALLGEMGFTATVTPGPSGADFLVTARRGRLALAP